MSAQQSNAGIALKGPPMIFLEFNKGILQKRTLVCRIMRPLIIA